MKINHGHPASAGRLDVRCANSFTVILRSVWPRINNKEGQRLRLRHLSIESTVDPRDRLGTKDLIPNFFASGLLRY